MRQNMERGSEVGEQHSQMKKPHKCLMFLMDRKDMLLPPFFIFMWLSDFHWSSSKTMIKIQ